ncbi:diguanylate cyclase domain-containing protein [Saccharopolyspora sp. CA-218241]|uniref:diguanylate cyclase domain-containing protein n=1 Tax=Saccharopolyspora sp. CA-218241 TaxID=3240027 RepID=UPI003D996EDA
MVGLLLCDVDRFKLINDRHGHRTGDLALRAVAADLAGCCRDAEVPIRLQGDEFAVLLPHLPEVRDAEARAREFRTALARTHTCDGLLLETSVSVGAAVDTATATTLSALLGWADGRMYGDKRARHLTALPITPAATRLRDLPREAA